MKIYLATAGREDVEWGVAHGLLDGVVTTPALLAESAASGGPTLADLCRLVQGPIFAAVGSVDAAGAYRDGRELAKLSDQMVVQLPLLEETLGAMGRLQADGIRVAATHVFSVAQALLAVRAGASSVVTQLDLLDATGHDAVALVRDLRAALDASHAAGDVIALHPASPAQFGACALAGADAAILPAEVIRSFLVHPLTDRGLDQFLGDVARLRRAAAP